MNSNQKTIKNNHQEHRSSPILIKKDIDESKIDVINDKVISYHNISASK